MSNNNNNIVYVILYINIDNPEYSEVLGVYNDKNRAVNEIIQKAHYREVNGQLTYYMEPCNEYDSFDQLRQKVFEEMEIIDLDIYRITSVRLY